MICTVLRLRFAEIALARAGNPEVGELLHLAAFRRARGDAHAVRAALRRDGDLRGAVAIGAGVHVGGAYNRGSALARFRQLQRNSSTWMRVRTGLIVVVAGLHGDGRAAAGL